ncbi:choice-of-anchor D domain-containing protein [Sorangium sp. So ce281]|uniref:choice-of-anchor D domain-containing protein n=1 Tax=unclassified Sorangium TaxID=2621164 RepID=UPI003F5D9467
MTSTQPDVPSTSSSSALTFSPNPLGFGPVPAGEAAVQVVVVRNGTSEAANLAIDASAAEFSIASGPTTVDAGQVAELFLQYRSAAEGTHAGTLTATGLSGELGRCSLSGTTIPSLTIDPGAIAFGDVPVGQTRVDSFFVTNATGSDVNLELISGVGGTFTLSPSTVRSTAVPTLIAVTYVPDDVGAAQATIRLSDALTASLSGNGIVPEEPDDVNLVAAQRFKVEVPFDHARLFLGAGVTSSPAGTFSNVDGCGLDADSNIYLSARTGRIFAQAGTDVFLQADGGIDGDGFAQLHQQGSDGKAILSSNGATYVAGKRGVVISAGVKVGRKNGDSFDESAPDTDKIDNWTKFFAAVDVVVATKLAYDAIRSYLDDRKSTPPYKQCIEFVAAGIASTAPFVGVLGAAGKIPGITMFGAGGISIFSPAYTAVYGVGGLALVSLFPTMFGLIDATIWAGDDVGITAATGSVKVFGSESVNVHSAKEVSIEASTNKHKDGGEIKLMGKSISIGSDVDSAKAPETSQIKMGAQSLEIRIGVGFITMNAQGHIELGTGDNKITIGPEGIKLDANCVTASGGASKLELSDRKTQLAFEDHGKGGKLVINQDLTSLYKDPNNGVFFAEENAVVKYNTAHKLELDTKGAYLYGKKQNLGL